MEKNIDQLIGKAIEITEKLGYKGYNSTSYHYYYYNIYKFDQLEIISFSDGNVSIYIGNIKVLNYDNNNKKVDYIKGKWMELINVIYDRVPLMPKQIDEEKRIKQNSDYLDLIEVFRHCKKYIDNNDEVILDYINSNLAGYGITISKETHYTAWRNSRNGEDKCIEYYIYFIKCNGDEVAAFKDCSERTYDNDYFSKMYKPGAWVTAFKRVIANAMKLEQSLAKQQMDSTVNESIRKFKSKNY